MNKAERKYYVCEGPEAEALAKQVWDDQKKLTDLMKELKDAYQADGVFLRNNQRVTALIFSSEKVLRGIDMQPLGDGKYKGVPNRRFKEGRKLVEDLKAASLRYSPSEFILDHYDANRMVPTEMSGSRTGFGLAVAVGFPLPDKKRLTLDVPVDPNDPFVPSEGVREIKHSEYIALTEEGA